MSPLAKGLTKTTLRYYASEDCDLLIQVTPWTPDTCSWVVPTAFAVLVLKQSFVCCQSQEVRFRIARGVEMLLDRICPHGGWNAGNSVVYGAPLAPHIDATAAALLAMRGETQSAVLAQSLDWLEQRAQTCRAPWSLA